MQRWWLASGYSVALAIVVTLSMTCPSAWAQEAKPEADTVSVDANNTADATAEKPEAAAASGAAAEEKAAENAPAEAAADNGIRSDFLNFLHFAIIGRFDFAQAHAKSLLQRPDVNPLSKEAAETIVELCKERPAAIDTLITLITNSTIGDDAGKVMALIREAHRQKRMDPEQIAASIKMLAGNPTEQATGLERLIDSGEYAVPAMVTVLADPRQQNLQPYVIRALPRLGKPAVNPLTVALSVPDANAQRFAAEALGQLGYPEALPYLKRVATDAKANEAVRHSATEAIRAIVVADPRVKDAPAPVLFKDLAEAYYAEEDSLCPDRNEPRANVWVVNGDSLKPIDVPRQIFCMVMAMKCCRASLAISPKQTDTLALWLAADFRRESRLGLNVESAEKAVVDDATQPDDLLRGSALAARAGAECCGMVLARGLKDLDRPVVLGAIAGLAVNANPNTVYGKGPGLAEALRFPDQLARIRAALVLGRVLPKQPFPGDNEVVPVLASAYSVSGQKSYLVVDPDKALADTIAADLTKAGAKVVTAGSLPLALAEAARQVNQLDAIFIASDIARPGPVEALRVLAKDERYALAPVVVYVKEGGMLVADQVADADGRVGRVLVVPGKSPADLLTAKAEQIGPNYGYTPLSAEDGVKLSLLASRALQWIASNNSPIFDPAAAEKALVTALNTHASEEVRIAATRVLALLNTATAQPAIAKVALSSQQTPTLRIAAFASLAESARYLGNRLPNKLVKELIEQAKSEPDLKLRTAASQALGSTINMPAELAVEAILGNAKGG